jgi:wyosine [tRNA(Phe)-imidazoG37] synthetase (radical SAM superfamily)
MIDINFYMDFNELNKKLLSGEKMEKTKIQKNIEEYRRKEPVVYNIETTNACNMKCRMCPRTTMMTRSISTIERSVFIKIIDQLRPWKIDEWGRWENYVKKYYGIQPNEMSENHFFLYIIPDVIQLHGYGDPLLDKNMADYIKLLSERNLKSYFSCNPANINIEKTIAMFENGLDYIKYSIESVDDKFHKEIRGEASNFTKSYEKILQLLDLKEKNDYKTKIIITMLDLNNEWQEREYEKLLSAFEDLDVYIYIKSEDQQWYRKDYHGTKSIHWSEICKHPWMSISVKSNAEIAMCMEDFNNEIILGDASIDSLHDIWNGEKYDSFRKEHLSNQKGIKCTEQCDMKVIGDILK